MKKFIKIDFFSNHSLIISIDEISHVYFDFEHGKYVICLKTFDNGHPIEFFLSDNFSIDDFYLEIEDRFPL